MSIIRCEKIKIILAGIATEFGWADYSYTFVKSVDWSNPSGFYVRETTPEMKVFYEQYKQAEFHFINSTLLKSDLPRVYDPTAFGTCPQGIKLAELYWARGWKSGLVYATYGYGGVMGVIALNHRELHVDSDKIKSTITELDKWRGQFNEWARKLVNKHFPKSIDEQLSPREIDCMALVAEGKTSSEIAETLGITKRTVDFHINNGMLKLGGTSRSQAALMMFLSPMPHMSLLSKFE